MELFKKWKSNTKTGRSTTKRSAFHQSAQLPPSFITLCFYLCSQSLQNTHRRPHKNTQQVARWSFWNFFCTFNKLDPNLSASDGGVRQACRHPRHEKEREYWKSLLVDTERDAGQQSSKKSSNHFFPIMLLWVWGDRNWSSCELFASLILLSLAQVKQLNDKSHLFSGCYN